ncbi:unnamed protein product [Lymnaea stagnalis]|uniref:NFX1-type zinc finger-containing protein 1 n=1 Tax=Lymnaea stagnalis TaxID=6523 RepID=A0AAV2I7B7_LYMST
MNSRRPRRRGGRGRSSRAPSQQRGGSVSYTKLKEWAALGDNPGELFVRIMHNLDQLAAFLDSDVINSDKMELLAAVLQTTLTFKNQTHGFKNFLEVIASSKFFPFHLVGYMTRMRRGDRTVGVMVKAAMRLVIEIARCLPSEIESCRDFVDYVYENDTGFDYDGDTPTTTMIDSFDRALELNIETDEGKLAKCVGQDEPPEDFREMTVLPSERDVNGCVTSEHDVNDGAKPFFRANKVVGSFQDKREYFDVMFRLLREDFMRPLRETVSQCRQGSQQLSDSKLILYDNVRIIGARVENGIVHSLLLDIAKLNKTKWDCTKYFMTGNLVCVSNDNFDSVLFATVGHNSPENLLSGILYVQFYNSFDAVYGIAADEKLKLIESPSFFVAYRYVLEGLQDMFDSPLPMEPYLVQCEPESKQTSYITDTTCYDINSIKGDDLTRVKWSPQKLLPTDSWPRLTKVCLNEEQYTAVKVALTQELTLLQGPPGTGKTYVSWKLMRILLENRGRGVPDDRPILVVCFTNHALDQFLEGLLPFCAKGLVRVGGQSTSTALKSYNLGEIRLKRKTSQFTSMYKKSVVKKMRAAEREIKQLCQEIKMFQVDIPELDDLKDFMSASHLESLLDGPDTGPKLKLWLDMEEVDLETSITTAVQSHLVSLMKQCTLTRKERCLDFRRNIPMATKAAVYKNWVSEYERKSGRPFNDTFLGEEILTTVISDNVLTKIQDSGYENISDWLLGRDVDEMLDSIDELKKDMFQKREGVANDEIGEDSDVSYGDYDSDDGEFQEFKGKFDSRKVDILNRALMLGVDVTMCGVASSENTWMKLTFGQALRKIKVSVPMSQEEEKTAGNVWILDRDSRYRLYKLWYNSLMMAMSSHLKSLTDQYNLLLEEHREIRDVQDSAILREATVVGMTTTGAARSRKLLRTIGPRIIVVEEAAEVLEAHIITALNEHCQHLILIGDHQQLRPRTQVYELAKEFGLEVSMFERLVNNKFTCIQLVEQHRMRPEISVFMRLIYPDLKDSESVKGRPSVSGMDKNVFFIKHNQPENNVKNSASKLNNFEARYLIKLCEYLIIQGYGADEITILGAYSGQVTLIQELIRNSKDPCLEKVHVSTVDNFQGEQNKIILLSLVRSNVKERVGFLSTDNRVCVALSRAQFGMYVIGDIDLLVRHSDLWCKISETAERQECIGSVLRLRCQQHGRIAEIVEIKDWTKALQLKGCGQPCETTLTCGHACLKLCHVGGHDDVVCNQACLKTCPRGHKCKGRCGRECPACPVPYARKLPCGHSVQVICGYQYGNIVCRQPCLRKCPAGHACPLSCKDTCSPCSVLVQRLLPCGHEIITACRNKSNVFICLQRCEQLCPRGHQCQSKCSELCPPCSELVHKRFPCGHIITEKCSIKTMCKLRCKNICVKGHPCPKRCGEPCSPCATVLPCGHICTDLPSDSFSRDTMCYQPCRCVCVNGHACPNKCPEACPKSCQKILRCGHKCAQDFGSPSKSCPSVIIRGSPSAKIPGSPSVKISGSPSFKIRGSPPFSRKQCSEYTGCGITGNYFLCDEPCQKVCGRGHECLSNCSEACLPCREVLECGHFCESVPKSVFITHGPIIILCEKPCKKVCRRGHLCPNKCCEACPPTCQKLKCKIAYAFSSKKGFRNASEWPAIKT